LIIISIIFFISCNENKDDKQILDIVIDDFKTINHSTSISIDISQNPNDKGRYYFSIKPNSTGFERSYYSISYKKYDINIYDGNSEFDMAIFSEYNLQLKEPRSIYSYEIDDSNEDNIYVYVINDSIVEKRMVFDFLGDIVEEKSINKKWRQCSKCVVF